MHATCPSWLTLLVLIDLISPLHGGLKYCIFTYNHNVYKFFTMHHLSKLEHQWVNFHVSLGFVVWGFIAFKQPVCIWICKCDSKFSQSYTDKKSINYISLLETFKETEKGMDFTQRRARKEFADRCFGRELTLQQVTLKVICFLHSQCLWQNCSSFFKCLYNIVTLTVLVIEADFPANFIVSLCILIHWMLHTN